MSGQVKRIQVKTETWTCGRTKYKKTKRGAIMRKTLKGKWRYVARKENVVHECLDLVVLLSEEKTRK